MSDLNIENLSPAPFFARFLEGQNTQELSKEEMQGVRGGTMVTDAYPSDQPNVPGGHMPGSIMDLIRVAREWGVSAPGYPLPQEPEMVTLAYPSDSDVAGSDISI